MPRRRTLHTARVLWARVSAQVHAYTNTYTHTHTHTPSHTCAHRCACPPAHTRARAHGTPTLLRGRDAWKDQTYFLFSLTQEQLAATLFPVGGLTKSQVRDHARHLGLPNAERAESQDACLGGGDTSFAEALRLRFDEPARPGPLVDEAGKVLALHQGIHHFTIGQRRGLGVATGRKAYVAAIEPEDNRVVICHDQVRLMAPGLVASDMHWLVAPVPDFEAEVQIRYQHRAVRAQVTLEDGGHRVQVTFAEPQRAVTAGQAVVLYDGERVLGGGWIERQGGHT